MSDQISTVPMSRIVTGTSMEDSALLSLGKILCEVRDKTHFPRSLCGERDLLQAFHSFQFCINGAEMTNTASIIHDYLKFPTRIFYWFFLPCFSFLKV